MTTTISVIIGSTREGRFSEKAANWIFQQLKKRDGVEVRLLDLRNFPMPFFDQAIPPGVPNRAPYENEAVKRWTAEIAASDGFIFITPEYNHAPPAVLKNAVDWVYSEWSRKACAFVSYGSSMGVRSAAILRESLAAFGVASTPSVVEIPPATLMLHFQGGDVEKGLGELEGSAKLMLDDLLWWTQALKTARTGS